MNKSRIDIYKLSYMAVLIALSIVLVLLIRIPIFPQYPFLEYDPADVPVLIVAFLYGPFYGLIVTAIVSLIQGLTVSAGSGFIGILMHFIATGMYVIVAGNIYKYIHTFKGALISIICGIVIWVFTMILMNLILTPIFMGVPISVVKKMILPVILPFNLIKASINSAATLVIYKKLHRLFIFIENKSKNKRNDLNKNTLCENINKITLNSDEDNSKINDLK